MQVDKVIFYLTVILMTISVIFVFSMSIFITSHNPHYTQFHFFIKQAIAATIGITIMWWLSTLDPDKWFKPIGATLLIFFFLLIVAMHFFPESLVKTINGAKRWITIPHLFSIAPVEFFKIGFIFFLSWSFSRRIEHKKMDFVDDISRFFPYLILFFVVAGTIAILQNEFGQVFLMGLIMLIMALMAGVTSKVVLFVSLNIILIGSYYVLQTKSKLSRIMNWIYDFQALFAKILPEPLQPSIQVADPHNQISASYNAIKSGGFFGKGLGNGVIKLGFLPEVHTDFILSGIAEEIGIFGVGIIAILYFILIFRMLKISNRIEDKMYSNFVFGIALMIIIAFFMNAFGITGAIPMKGIAIPFLSYGGSSLIANCIAVGMVLMISKKAKF